MYYNYFKIKYRIKVGIWKRQIRLLIYSLFYFISFYHIRILKLYVICEQILLNFDKNRMFNVSYPTSECLLLLEN